MIGQIYEWMQVRRGWPQAPLTGVNRTMGTRGGLDRGGGGITIIDHHLFLPPR